MSPQSVLTTGPGDLSGAGPSYDPLCALATAEHAVASYLPDAEYRREVERAGFSGSLMFSRSGSQAGLSWSPTAIVAAFRGSSERGDWTDDAAVCLTRWPQVLGAGQTTVGFRRYAGRILEEVLAAVLDLRNAYPTAKLVLSGHSLGATAPALFALALLGRGIEPDAVYCHAMPRTFDTPGAHWYDGFLRRRTFRVVVVNRGEQDLVTRVPLSRWGFRHVGVPEIIVDGTRFESEERWEAVRATRKVGPVESLRIITRAVRATRAHFGGTLLAALRDQVKR